MTGILKHAQGIKALAYRDFVPQTREAAVAQLVDVAIERRAWAAQSECPGPCRQLAVMAARKAKIIRDRPDWRQAANEPLGQLRPL